ncbi:MAG: hypothetical protein WBD20_01170 [Pirellulaceae bacterium]
MPDDKIETSNPYAPTTEHLEKLPSVASEPMAWGNVLWFMPGCVLGLNLGFMIKSGLQSAIDRTTHDSVNAVKFFFVFSVICVVTSMIWRAFRIIRIGRYPMRWFACFVGGCVMATSFVVGVETLQETLQEMSLGRSSWYPSQAIVILTGALASVLGVETEVWLGRLRKRS